MPAISSNNPIDIGVPAQGLPLATSSIKKGAKIVRDFVAAGFRNRSS